MSNHIDVLAGALRQLVSSARPALCLLLLLLSVQAGAQVEPQWIQASGQALIVNGDRELALARAKENALREAALRYQAGIASEDKLEDGVLTHSRLTVRSNAEARQIRILNQHVEGKYALVTLEAIMSEGFVCRAKDAQYLRKRVAVAGFAMVEGQGASLGNLHNAGRALPEYLYQQLLAGGYVEPLSMSHRQLYNDFRNMPTIAEADNSVHKTLGLARDLNVQFVIGGVIRDLGPVDENAWGSSMLGSLRRGLGLSNQNRRFVMDLVVHDGFSGSPVMERRYEAVGSWDTEKNSETGFMSPAFMATSYGQAVAGLLEEAATDVSDELRCQPFMSRITRVEDRQVYLANGASSGLRPGQALSIYRRFELIDVPGDSYELQPTQTELRIDQVHPDFSRGRIPIQAGRRNIQQDDVAIVW